MLGEAVSLRAGSIDDLDAILRIWIRANAVRRGEVAPEEIDPEVFDLTRGRMLEELAKLVVAERSGAIVGMAILVSAYDDDTLGPLDAKTGHISLVAVDPDYWGGRIGAMLMRRVIAEAVSGGFTRVQLWTQRTNERAGRLYRSIGFATTGRFRIDHHGEHIEHYELELPATPP